MTDQIDQQTIHQQVAIYVGQKLSQGTVPVSEMQSMSIAMQWLQDVANGKIRCEDPRQMPTDPPPEEKGETPPH